jgi:hypothetical protein
MMIGFLALIVFFASFIVPIVMAIYSWKIARISRSGWLIHLLFAPSAIICEWIIIEFLGFTTGDHGDGPPGAGFLYAPAFLTLIIAIFGYYTRLATTALVRKFSGRMFIR